MQQVQIMGELSEGKIIVSGIPQGTVLGPFLFLMYVKDLPDVVIQLHPYLFVDDNKIWKETDSREEDKKPLQVGLNNIYDWSNKWLMELHPDKLIHMDIAGTMGNPQHEYTVGGWFSIYNVKRILEWKLTRSYHSRAILRTKLKRRT